MKNSSLEGTLSSVQNEVANLTSENASLFNSFESIESSLRSYIHENEKLEEQINDLECMKEDVNETCLILGKCYIFIFVYLLNLLNLPNLENITDLTHLPVLLDLLNPPNLLDIERPLSTLSEMSQNKWYNIKFGFAQTSKESLKKKEIGWYPSQKMDFYFKFT